MLNKWRIESETDSAGTTVIWVSVRGVEGARTANLVAEAKAETVKEILSSGMLYISGPGLPGNTLFRVENCRRARIQGCMFINAVEAVDPLRCRENDILREMRSILELGASDHNGFPGKAEAQHIAAS